MQKPEFNEVQVRIQTLRAACTCAEQVLFMKDDQRRQVLKETMKILGCEEKVEPVS